MRSQQFTQEQAQALSEVRKTFEALRKARTRVNMTRKYQSRLDREEDLRKATSAYMAAAAKRDVLFGR